MPKSSASTEVTTQVAFVLCLHPDMVLTGQETQAELLALARGGWATATTAARLVLALELLNDRRLLARAATAALRLSVQRLALEALPLAAVLDTAEAWANEREVSDDAMAQLIAVARRAPEREPPGARALMALAIWSVANVVDDEQAPGLAAVGAVEVAADAWFDHGAVDGIDEARRILADEVRRVIDPWAALTVATAMISIPTGDDELPF